MLMRALRSIVLGCSISGGLLAQTIWIVDDSNLPGTHFTDIPPAIAAAADGDVLMIRAGVYSAFTLAAKGLKLLADHSFVVGGLITIQDTSAAQPVVVSRLITNNNGGVKLQNCAGPVFLDWSTMSDLQIVSCVDVRAQRLSTTRSCTASGSRFETWLGNHVGRNGWTSSSGVDGYSGVSASNASWVHIASTSCYGGLGGAINSLPYSCTDNLPGNGGSGVSVLSNSFMLAARGRHAGDFRGGGAGHESTHIYCASGGGGASIAGTSTLRISSGMSLRGGHGCLYGGTGCGGHGYPAYVFPGSALINAPQRDPVLDITNRPYHGSPIRVRLYAPAGSTAVLLVGTDMSVTPTAGVIVPQLTTPLQTLPLGVIPVNESIGYDVIVPAQSTGTLVVVQGEVTLANGTLLRSNSVPVVYR